MSSFVFQYSNPYDMGPDATIFPGVYPLKPNKILNRNNCGGSFGIRIRKINNMSNSFSELIHRVIPSCLFRPYEQNDTREYDEDQGCGGYTTKRELEMINLMYKVIESVLHMRKAYASLQEAHSPWDPYKIKLSDVAVITELRKLTTLTETFLLSVPVPLRDVGTPYESALEKVCPKMKRKSKRRVSCSSEFEFQDQSMVEIFEACMDSVKEGSRSFVLVLLSLMKSVNWDITATVESITSITTNLSLIGPNHALESYVNRKLFQGFDHESFYLDESDETLTSDEFRSECFSQYSDMKSVDTNELLETLPTCQFGVFCLKKYLSVVHPKMEESLFGDLEQRRQVLAGKHPRSRFYRESFVGVAKAVWMLHLVAFSMDPLPSHFEGSMGVGFNPEYMENVARVRGRDVGGYVVGFPVSPGFKLGNGYVVKARVYLVPKDEV
ncbi:protein GRAVITROPIC IN THE LIGHT 1-like [Rutidosis leptorrhynchoides]|uniref:protein GRAVITROPIC IN THE LIGHT 1-like n=1 Tax=Rutidosis leptorrhynchoides TaxID=125765 RepID=UPI003A990541